MSTIPSSAVRLKPAQAPGISSQVREGRDKRVGTAFLCFSSHLVNAAVQYTQSAVLGLSSAYSLLTQAYVFMGWGISIFFFFFCHRRMRRVLNIRSFWIIYLSYTFLYIQRKTLGDNYCRFSFRVTDFCVSAGKEGWRREKNIPCGLSITDSHGGKDFLIHSRPFTYFFFWNPLSVFEFSESLFGL